MREAVSVQLIQIDDLKRPSKPPRWALFELGFRPFYLAGSVFAVVAMAVWLAFWATGAAGSGLPGVFWHAHEMVFGFGTAIIAGFLLTAIKNWTGLSMPAGVQLGVFVGVWLAGRVAMAVATTAWAACIDVAFLCLFVVAVARKFVRAGSVRQWPIVVVLSGLALANGVFHLAWLGWLEVSPMRVVEAGLYLIVVLACVIGGRVIPGFTANALRHVKQYRRQWVDRWAIGLTALAFVLYVATPWGGLTAAVALGAALMHGLRWLGWGPWATWRNPLLWSLHLAYAWIPLGLMLIAIDAAWGQTRLAALHALGVGAMAGLILAMITRTALGHTARPLVAGGAETAAFGLIHLGALLRVGAALVPAWHHAGVWLAGAAWMAAFGLYVVAYLPILTRPRLDGRRG